MKTTITTTTMHECHNNDKIETHNHDKYLAVPIYIKAEVQKICFGLMPKV